MEQDAPRVQVATQFKLLDTLSCSDGHSPCCEWMKGSL